MVTISNTIDQLPSRPPRAGRDVRLCHREAALPTDLQLSVEPLYSADIWRTLPGENYNSDRNLAALNDTFFEETRGYLAQNPLQSGDVVFIPTITQGQLLGSARLATHFVGSGARFVILLRYQRPFYEGPVPEQAFRLLEKCARSGKVELCTDSHRLALELGSLTSLEIRTYPIPHTDHLGADDASPRSEAEPVHFVSLGNARGEKGMAEILAAARICAGEAWGERVRFTIQCNDPSDDIREALDAFARDLPARVTLIDRALDTQEYYQLLRSADVILTPYHHAIYSACTSGVFLEALNAGKIVICTRDTWMSDLLQIAGGGVAIADCSVTELIAAIKSIAQDFSSFDKKARKGADRWRIVHSPTNLVSYLLGAPLMGSPHASADIKTGRRAAVIFPWGDVVNGQSGATTRLKFLLKMLEQHYDEVRVLFPGESSARLSPVTFAEAWDISHQWKSRLKLFMDKACEVIWRKDKSLIFHLWFHIWPRFDKSFDRHCEAIIRWADDVYLEYSYFAPVVARHCQTHGRSVLVTQYDILSEQARGLPLIYQLTRFVEFDALRKIPRVIVATEYERQLCVEQGIQAEVIPHPIDARGGIEIGLDESRQILRNCFALDLSEKKVCLFIGGSFGPNRHAAAQVREIARSLRRDAEARDVMFLVAGACMDPVREENFAALGPIENVTLAALYRLVDLVLVPLAEGTGSSIKSIEALARGQLVLSTPIGMRGLAVEPDKHVFIEPDIKAFPARIKRILNGQRDADLMRANARDFGAAFDYRTVFEAYRFPENAAGRRRETPVPTGEPASGNPFIELLPRVGRSKDRGALQFVKDKCPESALTPAELAQLAVACAQAAPEEPETMRLLARAEEADPDNFELKIAKWRLMRERGEDEKIEEEVETYVRTSAMLHPSALSNELRQAAWRLFHGKEMEMTRLLACAGIRRPELSSNADLHYLCALSMQELGGDPKIIRSEYDRALELGFDPAWIYYHRGRLRVVIGDVGGHSDLEQARRLGGGAAQAADQIVRALGW